MFYNNNRYIPEWRLRLVHMAAKIAGLTVHVHGMPYGSSSRRFDLPTEKCPDFMLAGECRVSEGGFDWFPESGEKVDPGKSYEFRKLRDDPPCPYPDGV